MLSLQLQAILPNACTIQRFLARPTAWVGLVSCKQVLGGDVVIYSLRPVPIRWFHARPIHRPIGNATKEPIASVAQ